MADPAKRSGFKVLIVGAGSVGLLIAQRLKTLNISFEIYEREAYMNARPRDWNFGIYWAQSPLAECLPPNIQEAITQAQVDPNRLTSEKETLPILNAETGEALIRVPIPNVLRLNRKRFREVLMTGLDVQFGKRLSAIECSETEERVTAMFEDGTQATGSLLIGADGASSGVRNYLLGPDQGALHALPLRGGMTLGTLPSETSSKLRKDIDGQMILGYHPKGLITFISLHDVPDGSPPERWVWMCSLTWRDYSEGVDPDPRETRRIWDEWSNKIGDPLHAAFVAAPEYSPIWGNRLRQWPTVAWDNRRGKVTLAGDAAHPMTYHRGQGLNNAIHDAAYLCRALNDVCHDSQSLESAIDAYDEEVVERGHEAVISSGENSMMLTDWDRLKESPMFKHGIQPNREYAARKTTRHTAE